MKSGNIFVVIKLRCCRLRTRVATISEKSLTPSGASHAPGESEDSSYRGSGLAPNTILKSPAFHMGGGVDELPPFLTAGTRRTNFCELPKDSSSIVAICSSNGNFLKLKLGIYTKKLLKKIFYFHILKIK